MKPLSEPERYRLFWREVVYQAIRDLLRPEIEAADVADYADAKWWVLDEGMQPGSFLWACAEAGVDAKALRDELKARGIE